MLQELWGSGLSAKEIAARLGSGITRNAVIGKAHRLGLSSRPSPIKRTEGKATGGSVMMKTRMSAPKAIGMRRDVVVGSGSFNGASRLYKEESEGRRTKSDSYSNRIFKGSQAAQAQAQQCRWPLGDPLKPGFRFCEHTAIPGLSYCYDHACVAYQGSKKKGQPAPKDESAATEAAPAPAMEVTH
jgi:GcrA cell cycle regulator